MLFSIEALALVLLLCLTMIGLMELGRRLGMRRWARQPESARVGLGAVEGALFALMGLLIAFTFSGAAARFDARRLQIVQEANDIGTAYLRIDLLGVNDRAELKALFREYLDSRLAVYAAMPDFARARAEITRTNAIQARLWTGLVNACNAQNSPATTTLTLSAANAMFDTAAARLAIMEFHPPMIIYALLVGTGLLCSLLAGFGMSGGSGNTATHRSWVHIIAFSVTMAAAVYVIVDLEHPRLGFIRMEAADQILVDVRKGMK